MLINKSIYAIWMIICIFITQEFETVTTITSITHMNQGIFIKENRLKILYKFGMLNAVNAISTELYFFC
jgi:hypothetical protein